MKGATSCGMGDARFFRASAHSRILTAQCGAQLPKIGFVGWLAVPRHQLARAGLETCLPARGRRPHNARRIVRRSR